MKFRTIFLTIFTLLALTIGGLVQAQDDFDPCFGLSAEDCAVINEASANGIGDAESFSMEMSVDFAAEGLTSVMAMADPTAEDAIDAVSFTLESTFDFAMDEDAMTEVYMNGSLTFSAATDGMEVEAMNVDVMLIGDVLYFNDGTGWMSIDLVRLMEDEDLAGQFGDLMDDESDPTEAMEDLGIDSEALGIVFGIINLDGFLTYERDGDDFIFTMNFAALQTLLAEENEDLLNEIVETAAEVDPSMAMIIPLVPTLISDGYIAVTQTVDTDANIVTALTVDSELELALGMLAGTQDVTTTDLTVDVSMNNFDSVDMVEAPADAVDITDMVLGMAASGMGE